MTSESRLSHVSQPLTSPLPLEKDERWALVLRIAESRLFSKASQLQDILLYICRRALTEADPTIREYDIGCNALGRKADFNPNEDNIVRVQISHLRKKLEEYFATEGGLEPLQVRVPKGSYLPRFQPRVTSETAHQPIVQGEVLRKWNWRAGTAWILVGIAMTTALIFFATRQRPATTVTDPILREAWHPFASLDANVLLSVATPLNLVMVPDGHQTFGSPTYPAPPEAYGWFRQHRPLSPGARLGMTLTDNMLGIGTMNAVVTTVNTLRALGSNWQILPERVAALAAMRGRNTILFGAPVDSEAITRSMENTPLVVSYDTGAKEFVIKDRQSGRILPPEKDPEGEFTAVYGLITVLNADRDGLGMLLFSGITSGGTQGAAEFFSSPEKLRALRQLLAREGLHGFPSAYQVVVKCTFSNLLLLRDEYSFHRVLRN